MNVNFLLFILVNPKKTSNISPFLSYMFLKDILSIWCFLTSWQQYNTLTTAYHTILWFSEILTSRQSSFVWWPQFSCSGYLHNSCWMSMLHTSLGDQVLSNHVQSKQYVQENLMIKLKFFFFLAFSKYTYISVSLSLPHSLSLSDIVNGKSTRV